MARRSSNKAGKTKNVRALDRAIDILLSFSGEKPSMSVLEIQRKVRLSRPTVYRLIKTLTSRGLIRAHGTPQRFSLDYAVGQLAQNWMAGLDPVAAGQPIVERLHAETKETVGLMILRDRKHFCVLELPSPHVLSMARGIGPMEHLGHGASGKAILAFMKEDEIVTILRTLPHGVDKKSVLTDLAAIRRDKVRVSRNEIFYGAVGIAAPYFDRNNRVVGSIIVFGPDIRFNNERIAKISRQVLQGAAELSAALGHTPVRRIQKPVVRNKA